MLVCLYAFVCLCVCVYMSICMYVSVCIYAHIYLCMPYTYALFVYVFANHLCVFVCFCMLCLWCMSCAYMCICLCLYANMCLYTSVYTFLCLRVFMSVNVYGSICLCLCTCLYLPVLCMSVSPCGSTIYLHMDLQHRHEQVHLPTQYRTFLCSPWCPHWDPSGDHMVQVMVQRGDKDPVFQSILSISAYLPIVTAQPDCACIILGS